MKREGFLSLIALGLSVSTGSILKKYLKYHYLILYAACYSFEISCVQSSKAKFWNFSNFSLLLIICFQLEGKNFELLEIFCNYCKRCFSGEKTCSSFSLITSFVSQPPYPILHIFYTKTELLLFLVRLPRKRE